MVVAAWKTKDASSCRHTTPTVASEARVGALRHRWHPAQCVALLAELGELERKKCRRQAQAQSGVKGYCQGLQYHRVRWARENGVGAVRPRSGPSLRPCRWYGGRIGGADSIFTGMKQPNILMVMADQLAPHFTGAYGHPLVRTPPWTRSPNEERASTRRTVTSRCVPLPILDAGRPTSERHRRLGQRR